MKSVAQNGICVLMLTKITCTFGKRIVEEDA